MRALPLLALALALPASAAPPPIVPYQDGLPPLRPTQPFTPQPYYTPQPYTPQPYAAPQPYAPPQSRQAPQANADREPSDFAGIVEAHNRARRAVGVPPLQWSPQLAATAQSWANRLRGEHCTMRHSRASGLGENLAWAASQQLSPARVVALWVNEAPAYNRAANTCAPGAMCGHYTQVIWRNTRFVGCGLADCGDSEVWVCNYSPPGNYSGERPY